MFFKMKQQLFANVGPQQLFWGTFLRVCLRPYMAHERRRHENILRKVLIQRNCEYGQCTTKELSFQWHRRSPGQRFVYGVEEIAHFSVST